VIQYRRRDDGLETFPILGGGTPVGDDLLPELPHNLQQNGVFLTIGGFQFLPKFLGQGGALAAGRIKSHRAGSSTMFTGIFSALASPAIRSFTASLSVAPIIRKAP
jgi:hypothetical protein